MRKFHPVIYFWLILFALTNSGCEYGVKVLEAVVNAVLEEEEETQLAYHQRRMQEVDGPGWTDLHRAAAKGDVAAVQKLLEQGVAVDTRNESGGTPLYEATRRGKLKVMKLFLKNGANVNAPGGNGFSPLSLAAEYNQVEAARLLLKHGANVNYRDVVGNTPLHQTALRPWHGDSKMAQLLIEEGKADMSLLSNGGCYPLYCAVSKNNTPVTLYLLSKGADANFKHRGGTQTLFYAVSNQNTEITRALLKHGANPNVIFKGLYTPLQNAVTHSNIEIVRLLLKYKSDPNKAPSPDELPLYRAIYLKHEEIVRMLLDHGADPMIKVRDRTILDYAIWKDNEAILDLIYQARLKRIQERRKNKAA
jgi:ankyrin repeat protein